MQFVEHSVDGPPAGVLTRVDPPDTGRRESLTALLRYVRSARRGRPSSPPRTVAVPPPFSGYLAWELGDLCALLFQELQAVEALDRADRDAFTRFYGLLGPPQLLIEVAAHVPSRHGRPLQRRQIQNRIARTLDALAGRLAPPRENGPGTPAELPRWPGSTELRRRLADPHYRDQLRRAVDGATALVGTGDPPSAGRTRLSVATALAQLESDAFGGDPPREHLGAPIQPWLRWRLRALAWITVVAISPGLAVRPEGAPRREAAPPPGPPPEPLAAVEGERGAALGETLLADLRTPGAIELLLDSAQEAIQAVDGLSARAWLDLAERALAGFGPRDLVPLRARALQLRVASEAHVGALAAFDRMRGLELLTGLATAEGCMAALDVSTMLSIFGYADESLEVLHRQWTGLGRLPRDQAGPLRRWMRLRVAVSLYKRSVARHATEDLALAERLVLGAAEKNELPGPEQHDLDRTKAQIDLAWGELAQATGRPGADDAFHRAAALLATPPPTVGFDPARGSIPGSFAVDFRWAMTTMATSIRTHDRDAFARGAAVGIDRWNGRPTVPAFGLSLRQLLDEGAAQFQLDLPALAPPAPFTGWDHAFRPSSRILTLVANRSWLCPTAASFGNRTRRPQETPSSRSTGSMAK